MGLGIIFGFLRTQLGFVGVVQTLHGCANSYLHAYLTNVDG